MKFIVALTLLLCAQFAFGVSYNIQRRDQKLASQKSIEQQTFTNPLVADADKLAATHAGATSAAAVTVTSFLAQPDMPRNLEILPGGTTGDVEACTIVVTGTDYYGHTITENFAFLANASTATVGSKAFKTVSSVLFPANCESGSFGATWDIGTGSKLGLKHCMANAGDFLFSLLNGSKEATAPTMAVSSSAVSGNTATFNGSLDGVNDFVLYFFQNFACIN